MKTFKIENSEMNLLWVVDNLDARDFSVDSESITINYYTEDQKNDIMASISKTYDIHFNDSENSNSKGFSLTEAEAREYIAQNNGTGSSYFAEYKGGTVSVVCNETEETVFETVVL